MSFTYNSLLTESHPLHQQSIAGLGMNVHWKISFIQSLNWDLSHPCWKLGSLSFPVSISGLAHFIHINEFDYLSCKTALGVSADKSYCPKSTLLSCSLYNSLLQEHCNFLVPLLHLDAQTWTQFSRWPWNNLEEEKDITPFWVDDIPLIM